MISGRPKNFQFEISVAETKDRKHHQWRNYCIWLTAWGVSGEIASARGEPQSRGLVAPGGQVKGEILSIARKWMRWMKIDWYCSLIQSCAGRADSAGWLCQKNFPCLNDTRKERKIEKDIKVAKDHCPRIPKAYQNNSSIRNSPS
jgi:hypothetical protein